MVLSTQASLSYYKHVLEYYRLRFLRRPIAAIETSLVALKSRSRSQLQRLIIEDEGVEGCCWFVKESESCLWLHILANLLRIGVTFILAPIFAFTFPIRAVADPVLNYILTV